MRQEFESSPQPLTFNLLVPTLPINHLVQVSKPVHLGFSRVCCVCRVGGVRRIRCIDGTSYVEGVNYRLIIPDLVTISCSDNSFVERHFYQFRDSKRPFGPLHIVVKSQNYEFGAGIVGHYLVNVIVGDVVVNLGSI